MQKRKIAKQVNKNGGKRKSSISKSKSQSPILSAENRRDLRLQVRLIVPRTLIDDPHFMSAKGIKAVLRGIADGDKTLKNVRLQAIDWEKGRTKGKGNLGELRNFIAPILSSSELRIGRVREIRTEDSIEESENL